MMPSPSLSQPVRSTGDYPFTDHDFAQIARIAHERYGLFLQPSKKTLVYSRLTKRLRALDLPDFESYCRFLTSQQAGDEQSHLLSALTTNVTHFFREAHHFHDLRSRILPTLVEKARAGTPIRIWSAACSAGQEAFSIAAVLRKHVPDLAKLDIRILGTDIDPQMIQKARHARYEADQLAAIPDEYRAIMVTGSGADFQIVPDIQAMITFGELNLIENWPMRRKFHVIFCRNAAIYFDKDTQSRLWQRFADILHEGGQLMIGHSERVAGPAAALFRTVGITTYERLPHTMPQKGAE
jgi:chemotaxis protein methyltransferase CheR